MFNETSQYAVGGRAAFARGRGGPLPQFVPVNLYIQRPFVQIN